MGVWVDRLSDLDINGADATHQKLKLALIKNLEGIIHFDDWMMSDD